MITLPNTITSLYFCGDLHWCPNILKNFIKKYSIVDSCIICCGDFGIGFNPKMEKIELDKLSKYLKLRNIYCLIFAGNHDDSNFFVDTVLQQNKYVYLIPTYTITNILGKNILNISGGISVDRVSRKQNDLVKIINYMKYHKCDYKKAEQNTYKTYWENEAIVYQPKVDENIDIICSHSAPSFCYPFDKGPIVQEFAQYDNKLIEDINTERSILDKVYEDYKDTITHWYYGHFHSNMMQTIDNISFKLLDIGEICRHYISSDNNNIL